MKEEEKRVVEVINGEEPWAIEVSEEAVLLAAEGVSLLGYRTEPSFTELAIQAYVNQLRGLSRARVIS